VTSASCLFVQTSAVELCTDSLLGLPVAISIVLWIQNVILHSIDRLYVVAQLAGALRYKSEGCGSVFIDLTLILLTWGIG